MSYRMRQLKYRKGRGRSTATLVSLAAAVVCAAVSPAAAITYGLKSQADSVGSIPPTYVYSFTSTTFNTAGVKEWNGKCTVQQNQKEVHMKQVRTLLGAFEP